MKTDTYKNINYEWLTRATGDPFADAGGYALKEFDHLYPTSDILDLIMKAADIYVDNWGAKINTFFLDSPITQPAYNAQRKKEETRKYFEALLNETTHYQEGICRITGQNAKLFPAGRYNSILSGSGTFVNFHHDFQEGIMLSKEIIIRLFFLPLACENLIGKIVVVHSNEEYITEVFAKKNCKQNISDIASNISTSILKSKSYSVGTALFRYADEIIEEAKNNANNIDYSITLYHFTNFGAKPEIQIYTLPSAIFIFYLNTQKGVYKRQWNSFVANYYSNKEYKNISYDEKENVIRSNNKNDLETIQESNFKFWRNKIYNMLLNGESIIKNILKWSRKHDLSLTIIRLYEKNIRKMKKETISKIEQMADFILSSNDEQGIKKAIIKLDGVKNSYLLRRFVLKDIVAKYYNAGNEEAIVTIEDYADYLFPDTNSWQETRDVLLIAIYQKLHEQKKFILTELSDGVITADTNENN
jgi:CRISPR-associated protein Cst1